jgi:hypothetical protein
MNRIINQIKHKTKTGALLWLAVILALGSCSACYYGAYGNESREAQQERKRWESFPEPYRPLLTSYGKVKDGDDSRAPGDTVIRGAAVKAKDMELAPVYEPLIQLLKTHPLDNYVRRTRDNVLRELVFIARAAVAAPSAGSQARIEMMLDDSEYFLEQAPASPLNITIANTILRGFLEWEYMVTSRDIDNILNHNTIIPTLDPRQRNRLAGLISRLSADPAFSGQLETQWLMLDAALLISYDLSQRQTIRKQLDQIMRACLFTEDNYSDEFRAHAFARIMYESESEKERMTMFQQVSLYSWMQKSLSLDFLEYGDSKRKTEQFFFLLTLFGSFENKMTIINKYVNATSSANLLHPNFRAILYHLWDKDKDRRWFSTVRRIIQKALQQTLKLNADDWDLMDVSQAHPEYYVVDMNLIDSEIALFQGELEKGLLLLARYLADHYNSQPSIPNNRYTIDRWIRNFRYGKQQLPFVKWLGSIPTDYDWPRPVTFYIKYDNGVTGYLESNSSYEVLDLFYWKINQIISEISASRGTLRTAAGDTEIPASVLKEAFMKEARFMARGH